MKIVLWWYTIGQLPVRGGVDAHKICPAACTTSFGAGLSMATGRVLDVQAAGQQVRDALGAVRDPELGRAITSIGFVAGVSIDGGRVHVRLRLPTYFGAPDLVSSLLADVRAAVAILPWVDSVDVCVGDHAEAGVASSGSPTDPFSGSQRPSGDEARQVFRVRAFVARQYEILRGLLVRGVSRADLCRIHVRDLPAVPSTAVYLQRRLELGLPTDGGAALVVTEDGAPVDPADIDEHLACLRGTTR